MVKKKNFLHDIAAAKKIKIPDQSSIVNLAKESVLQHHNYNPEQKKENFDDLIHDMEMRAYELYQEREQEYGERILKELVEEIGKSSEASFEAVRDKIGTYFKDLDSFFLSLAQSRKSRAGGTFENIINSLFKSLNYPFDEQQVINGKPDFLLPSRKHYDHHATDCIIFTVKRTLKERWRQIVTEGTRGLGFFLATIDVNVSKNQLEEMKRNRIYLVCPGKIKAECYNEAVNVITFAQFFDDYLDPAMKRWKKNAVI